MQGSWAPHELAGQSGDQARDAGMTFYSYPQPVLKPQLEHV